MFLDKTGLRAVPSLALEFHSKWRPNFWAKWTLNTVYSGGLTYLWRQTRESKSSSVLVPWDSGHSQVPFFLRCVIQRLNTFQRGSDGKNLLILQPLFTSNPTPTNFAEHRYSGMDKIWGMWIGHSKDSEDPRRTQNATGLFEHYEKDTTRVRHAKVMVFH